MKRRKFLKGAAAGTAVAASTLAAPAIAQSRKEMVIVSTWGRDFPGLGTSAQRLCKRITDVTEGRINVKYYAAGERVGAFDVFDAVASGNAQAAVGAVDGERIGARQSAGDVGARNIAAQHDRGHAAVVEIRGKRTRGLGGHGYCLAARQP